MPTTAETGSSLLNALFRAVAIAALGVGIALLFVFAAAAAVVVGLMILGAAIALRFAPRPVEARVLNARQTPTGWVVEGLSKRKS
ncbi:MAG: hypothetical protein QM759_16775 [Terricaulis sp.]